MIIDTCLELVILQTVILKFRFTLQELKSFKLVNSIK